MKHKILLVDDEIDNVEALERIFRRDYDVYKAISGDEGLDQLSKNPDIALIISDQRMPEMTGVQMLKKSISTHPDTIRILLTGYTDMESVVGAINSGEVYRYLNKPWDPVDLKNTVDKALEKFELRRELLQKNRELEAAYQELKVLDEAKNNFMILINHELKTPLTVISSYLELLAESKIDVEQTKYLERLTSSKNRLQKIVDDALALISAETGLTKLSPKKTSGKKVFNNLQGKFDEQIKKRDLDLIFEGEDDTLQLDEKIIVDVLSRIVDNAVKFADKGTEVYVKSKKEADGTRFLVTNQGKSLNQKTIEKILKPFALDEDIMNHSQGLGLGLSLSQALLKIHDSQLEIKSEKGLVEVSFLLA